MKCTPKHDMTEELEFFIRSIQNRHTLPIVIAGDLDLKPAEARLLAAKHKMSLCQD